MFDFNASVRDINELHRALSSFPKPRSLYLSQMLQTI